MLNAECNAEIKHCILHCAFCIDDRYSSSVSTRCACTMSSHGDHAKTVKRPSCDATSATASR